MKTGCSMPLSYHYLYKKQTNKKKHSAHKGNSTFWARNTDATLSWRLMTQLGTPFNSTVMYSPCEDSKAITKLGNVEKYNVD